MLEAVRSNLEDLILNTTLDIDEVRAQWIDAWSNQIDGETLHQIWIECLDEMPELN